MSDMPRLSLDDFPSVFEATHGYKPYAWQRRLLREVVETCRWPTAIAAPTGAGKTAVLDVALFHLALCAGERPRPAPMRIVLAVDRRIIVDQAYERACLMRDALRRANGGTDPSGRMSQRLQPISGGDALHVAELRGGMPLEHDWARRPDQPTILCTTVDQLGSRLLFRGYGVSPGMAPVHAGLLGTDALLILDEAHLSRAFEETLAAIARHRGSGGATGLPWCWTALTATPRAADAGIFRLLDEERDEPAIRERLAARKLVTLMQDSSMEPSPDTFAAQAQGLARGLVEQGNPAPVVAVVVNRVALARQTFDLLKVDEDADAILLTGRVRPVERDELVEKWRHRLEGTATSSERPLFVVATQCIEAGADFDFDAMVSQIAPLDALRQRFGRLARSGNRLGRPAPGVVLAAKAETQKQKQKQKKDPTIYGSAPAETWEWLLKVAERKSGKARGEVDFGPDALDRIMNESPPPQECVSPCAKAPLLREADIDALVMTAPRPYPDPVPALFLHGDHRDDAEVSLVWRADLGDLLEAARLAEARGDEAERDDAIGGISTVLGFLPPRPAEALRLPVWVARRWPSRKDETTPMFADVPGSSDGTQERPSSDSRRALLRWRGAGDMTLVAPVALAPGDVIVLAAAEGGCDAFGWAPECRDHPARDLADCAARPYRGRRAALRLHPDLWTRTEDGPGWTDVVDTLRAGMSARELARACGLSDDWATAPGLALVHPYGDDPAAGALLVAPRGLAGTPIEDDGASATEADEGVFGTVVTLDAHSRAVASHARNHADRLGLPDSLASTLERAGLWHDAGKADPRFQEWLRLLGGLANPAEPIAKSGRRATPLMTQAARKQAMLPDRWRHEVASVRCAAARLTSAEAEGADPALLLWLIGTHHGHGRPFFPHDDDWDDHAQSLLDVGIPPSPGPDKLDFDWNGRDWATLMQELRAHYGPWGLAFLEACLRLADHRASAGEGA